MVNHSRAIVSQVLARQLRGYRGRLARVSPAVVLVLLGILSAVAAAQPIYTLQPVEYGMQLKTPDGRVVFEYMTKKPENVGLTSPSVTCFHPVNTPLGER